MLAILLHTHGTIQKLRISARRFQLFLCCCSWRSGIVVIVHGFFAKAIEDVAAVALLDFLFAERFANQRACPGAAIFHRLRMAVDQRDTARAVSPFEARQKSERKLDARRTAADNHDAGRQLEFWMLGFETLDLCEQVSNVELDCPLDKGTLTIVKDVDLPKEIPPVSFGSNSSKDSEAEC